MVGKIFNRKLNIMREIVLDTETTGLDPNLGHRIVEIGCLELKNHIVTGEKFHVYVNPRRDMAEEAFKIHGLSTEFLKEHPPFEEHVDAFLDFIKKDRLIIHNARFDMKFINAELEWCGRKPLPFKQAHDTLKMAREKHPGSPASLDALCKRYKIDNSNRTLHGALLDSELLAEVYLELIGGAQPDFMTSTSSEKEAKKDELITVIERQIRKARDFDLTPDEIEQHKELLKKLKNPIWAKKAS